MIQFGLGGGDGRETDAQRHEQDRDNLDFVISGKRKAQSH